MSDAKDMLRVTVDDGKYTLVQDATGKQFALRYGEPWRDLVGDGLTLALGYSIEEARKLAEDAITELESYHIDWAALNKDSPDHDPNYKIQYPDRVVKLRERLKEMSK